MLNLVTRLFVGGFHH